MQKERVQTVQSTWRHLAGGRAEVPFSHGTRYGRVCPGEGQLRYTNILWVGERPSYRERERKDREKKRVKERERVKARECV